jgi:hypothetical protein
MKKTRKEPTSEVVKVEASKNKLYTALINKKNGAYAGSIHYSDSTGVLEIGPTPEAEPELANFIKTAVYYNVYKDGEAVDQIVVEPSVDPKEYVLAMDKAVLGRFVCTQVSISDEN